MQKRRALSFFSVVSCFLFFLTSCGCLFRDLLLTVNINGAMKMKVRRRTIKHRPASRNGPKCYNPLRKDCLL
jgi:hypothetical protein